IRKAVEEYGYSQREVADYLEMHYSSVSRIVNGNKMENSIIKT
ncbi:MAG: helix-turn-helix transcriptional regulator, partial [Nitrospirae bacterium]|nr:helix-turn-helix transcriptional regulator [Nitrospirota bacterium]MBI1821513.1 helix-turn-helix transcriptional regulator [Nitrospirota bacterium]MBI3352794.1 helix-turn-helix transcriptional regulator [Nitrospirota bacterium]MBI3353185.1 helix-turn-helix transcriptional regulator [Nitrospirota bacterium]